MEATRTYDVALSFAGEQRDYVERVAVLLRAAGLSVFYDEFEQATLWGRDLAREFDVIFRRRAALTVVFISSDYVAKGWPQHEFGSALARQLEEKEPYLLPVRFDETELPGLRPTIHYLDARSLSAEEISHALIDRLKLAEPRPASTATPSTTRVPRVPPADFNPYAESEALIQALTRGLEDRSRALVEQGFAVDARTRGERWRLRIMRHGTASYGLDVWLGGDWGDNTICFAVDPQESSLSNGVNATASVEWDRGRGQAVLVLHNFSLLQGPIMSSEERYTGPELLEAIWEEVCTRLEQVGNQ